MLAKHKIQRINQLAKKKRTAGLTEKEQQEHSSLQQEYLSDFRTSMKQQVEGLKVVDPDGRDVTPDKLKKIQAKKRLHDRK